MSLSLSKPLSLSVSLSHSRSISRLLARSPSGSCVRVCGWSNAACGLALFAWVAALKPRPERKNRNTKYSARFAECFLPILVFLPFFFRLGHFFPSLSTFYARHNKTCDSRLARVKREFCGRRSTPSTRGSSRTRRDFPHLVRYSSATSEIQQLVRSSDSVIALCTFIELRMYRCKHSATTANYVQPPDKANAVALK